MKNHLVLLSFCCLLFLACGNSNPSQDATSATKTENVKPSTTALNTAKNSTAIETPASLKTEVEAKPVSIAPANNGSKLESLQKEGKSKADKIKNQEKQESPQAPKEEKKQANPSVVKEKPSSAPTPTEVTTPIEKTKTSDPITKKVEEVVQPAEPVKTEPVQAQFSHTAWDQLLRKHVSSTGKVNYKGFKKDRAALDAYTQYLQDNPIQDNWSKSKKIAYWINVYNAFTVKLIVDNYPVASITDLHAGKPWDHKWIKIGGKTYTLNNIENDILRPKYKDARVHFAVNCAAKSCPPLLNRAWTANNLNSNYEKQTKAFINNSSYNKIASDKIEVSKIFEWYAVDFKDLIGFLNKYSTTKIDAGAKVNFVEYDWKLNE